MAEFVTRNGTLISHPETFTVREDQSTPAPGARRSGSVAPEGAGSVRGDPFLAALVDGLDQGDVDLHDTFELTPRQPVSERRSAGVDIAPEPANISIAVEEGEQAALLVERDGVFEWVLPEESEGGGPGGGAAPVRRRGLESARGESPGGPRTVTFRIGGGPSTGSETGRQRRNLLGPLVDGLVDKARVIVVRFVAGKIVDYARNRLEESIRPGLISMQSENPADWVVGETPHVDLPDDGSGRVLLFIHGTFSSTLGSFGALAVTDGGRQLLDEARQNYDAILAYDHRTLGDTPEENARAIVGELQRISPAAGTKVDIVAFSRGGLVARLLIERLLEEANWPLVPEKAIFIGCTNGGTALADRRNWKLLLDLFTNLAVAAGHGLSAFDAGTASTVLTQSVKTLTGFVQAVVDVAITEEMVPGLAAMSPTSALVTELNGPGADPDARQIAYFAIGSDFEPKLFSGGQDPGSFPNKLKRALADFAVDGLMKENNDLVVDTEAMTQFGGFDNRLVNSILWDANTDIFHTNYFAQEDVAKAIYSALAFGYMALSPPAARMEPSTPRPSEEFEETAGAEPGEIWPDDDGPEEAGPEEAYLEDGGIGNIGSYDEDLVSAPRRSDPPALETGFESIDRRSMPLSPASPSPRRSSTAPAAPASTGSSDPAPQADVTCHFGAEMPETAALEEEADLTVTVSREEIEMIAGPAAATGEALVRTGKPIQLEVRAKRNCSVVSEARVEVLAPKPGHPDYYDFRIKGTKAGPAEIWVDARQGARRLTRLVLQPKFVAMQGQIRAAANVDTGRSEKATIELRIIEERSTEDHFRLRYIMESRDLDFGTRNEVQEVRKNKNSFVSNFYQKLEGEWGRNPDEFDTFMDQIAAYGARMYVELVPEAIREAIWAHRKDIGCIEVMSEEPTVPWESLHVVNEAGKIDRDCRFLGEMGVVRWIDNLYWPPASLRIRPDRAHYVVPDYAEPALKLRGARDEIKLLKDCFQAQEVEATQPAVKNILRDGERIDLLHFACHGTANSNDIWNAALLMTGEKRPDNSYYREKLTVDEIDFCAILAHEDGTMPIVFINACQAGSGGHTLSGTGGLAETFVKCGAGLFVSALWSIGDKTALTFATKFYDALKAGETVVEAAGLARTAAKTAREPTWLAYTVYGHPHARLQESED